MEFSGIETEPTEYVWNTFPIMLKPDFLYLSVNY